MTFNDFLELLGALIAALGGTTVVVISLASWLSKVWANRILEKDKLKYQQVLEEEKNSYQKELEVLKTGYQKELEVYKTQLDITKTKFMRFNEQQFKLYNELWVALCDLKFIADELWEIAEAKKLKTFAVQLKTTKDMVEKSALLIEEEHYEDLISLLDHFSRFEFGKTILIKLRNKQVHQISSTITEDQIRSTIVGNSHIKDDYTELIEEFRKEFKQQICGSNK